MALTKCVECGKEISQSAKVCPHCGKKDPTITAKQKGLGCLVSFVILVVVFIIFIMPSINEIINEPSEGGFIGGLAKGLKLGLLPITIPLKLIISETEVDQEIQELSDIAENPFQSAFHKLNSEYSEKYMQMSNDIQRSNTFNKCNTMRDLFIDKYGVKGIGGWIGILSDISTDQGGDVAYINIRSNVGGFEIDYRTMNNRFSDMGVNSMLRKGTKIYNKVSQLKEGQLVIFQFCFILDNDRGIKEVSVTERGCVTAPDFIVRFSAIGKLNRTMAEEMKALYIKELNNKKNDLK